MGKKMHINWNQYLKDGFLIVPQLLTDEQCDKLNKQAALLCRTLTPPDILSGVFDTERKSHIESQYFLTSGDKISLFFGKYAHENGRLLVDKSQAFDKIGHALHALDPVFKEISTNEQIVELVKHFGMQKPAIAQSMYIFKHPHTCGEVVCHQDGTFLFTEPESTIGIWIALEDTYVENGCLWVAPGEHLSPLRERMIKDNDKTFFIQLDNTPWPTEKLIPIEIKKGSALLLHSRLPHASYLNKSAHMRPAYTLHIVDQGTHFAADNWLTPHMYAL